MTQRRIATLSRRTEQGQRVTLAYLSYNVEKGTTGLVNLDTVPLLIACKEADGADVHCYGMIYSDVNIPPFLDQDIHCGKGYDKKGRERRLKAGHIWTRDGDDDDGIVYGVALYSVVILKEWGTIWCHLSNKELDGNKVKEPSE